MMAEAGPRSSINNHDRLQLELTYFRYKISPEQM
jgi:hypothetical protein